MKIKKLLLLLLIALMVVSFIGCKGGGGTDKTPEPTDTPAPTDTPEPTATPTPTPEPTPIRMRVWMLYCIVLPLKVRI